MASNPLKFSRAKPARVPVVDDHPLVREGLAEALGREADLMICGEAEDRLQALQLVPSAKPDLAIVDLALKKSSGLDLIKDLQARFPEVLILVVSMKDERLHAERAFKAGASGFITKEEATAHVVEAVRQVLGGGRYASPQLTSFLIDIFRKPQRRRGDSDTVLSTLTDRELEIFQLIGEGVNRAEIASRLGLAVNTVETYRRRLKEKLSVESAQELLQIAIKAGRS